MYTTADLRKLARAYVAGTGTTLSRLGTRAANNDRLFTRLSQGFSCRLDIAERASWWFNANWPETVPWPKDVERREVPQPTPHKRRVAAGAG